MRAVCIQRHGGKMSDRLEKWAQLYQKHRFERYRKRRSTFYDYGEWRPVQFVIVKEKNG